MMMTRTRRTKIIRLAAQAGAFLVAVVALLGYLTVMPPPSAEAEPNQQFARPSISVTSYTATSVTIQVNWSPACGTSTQIISTYYRVNNRPPSLSVQNIFCLNHPTQTLTRSFHGLQTGTSYTFWALAPAAGVSVTVIPGTPPPSPTSPPPGTATPIPPTPTPVPDLQLPIVCGNALPEALYHLETLRCELFYYPGSSGNKLYLGNASGAGSLLYRFTESEPWQAMSRDSMVDISDQRNSNLVSVIYFYAGDVGSVYFELRDDGRPNPTRRFISEVVSRTPLIIGLPPSPLLDATNATGESYWRVLVSPYGKDSVTLTVNSDGETRLASSQSATATTLSCTTDNVADEDYTCLLYTSPSPRDRTRSRMPSSA